MRHFINKWHHHCILAFHLYLSTGLVNAKRVAILRVVVSVTACKYVDCRPCQVPNLCEHGAASAKGGAKRNAYLYRYIMLKSLA